MLARRLVRQAPLLVVAALCASTTPVRAHVPTIDVSGRQVAVSGDVTVEDALKRARVVVPAGHVLSAVTHRPLAGDHQPGQVLLDGMPAAEDTIVPPGGVLTVVPGADVTEPLRLTSELVPPAGGVASLLVGGTPGSEQVVEGAYSGETVSRHVVRAPRPGHLVAPRAVALTFDDGPDPRWTPYVLAMLARFKVHATFCLIGRQVVQYPELVRLIVADGNQLCNHTWSHDEKLGTRSPEKIHEELARTQRAIQAAAGVTPVLFRAPGGVWSAAVVQEARRQGMTPLKWSVDPRDWVRPGTLRIAGVVLAKVRPGSIVLMHDGGGNRSETVAALRLLLVYLPRLHYSFAQPLP